MGLQGSADIQAMAKQLGVKPEDKLTFMKSLPLPEEMPYFFSETLFQLGQYDNSQNFVNKYLELTGFTGQNYEAATRLKEKLKVPMAQILACEQCDRTVFTQLEPIQNFEAYLQANPKPKLKLLLSPDATKSLYSVLLENDPQDIVLMIGPEGGHSPAEEALAQAAGYQIVSLGERVLRTETAAVVAITAVHSVWNPEMQNRLK
jgi:hypothetical protein